MKTFCLAKAFEAGLRRTFLAALMGLCSTLAAAQTYPNKPIRMVAPEPGGGIEVAGRTIAQALSDRLGQRVIIDNRGAAGGTIAAGIVAKAAPDGYTLMVYGSSIWLAPFLRKNVTYDPLKDFSPITLAAQSPYFIYVHASVPAKSLKELIALAKARPGDLRYGSAGAGSGGHLASELFNDMAGVNIMRVAYRGSGPAGIAFAGGEVHVMINSASIAMSQVKTGRVRVLAVASAQPSALAPGVPTTAAAGLPGYETGSMTGIFGPAKMPRSLVARLNQETVQVLNQASVKEFFLNAGIEAVGSTPEQFASVLKTDVARWSRLITKLGIVEE